MSDRRRQRASRISGLLFVVLCSRSGLSQSGGGYELTSHVIAGGGASALTGDGFSLSATIGQVDAGVVARAGYEIDGGFWTSAAAVAPTSTPSSTATRVPSSTPTEVATATQTETAVAVVSATPTNSMVSTFTPSVSTSTPTVTPTSTTTPTATGTMASCRGDCDMDGAVIFGELVDVLAFALGQVTGDECRSSDGNEDGLTSVEDVVLAVNDAGGRCSP